MRRKEGRERKREGGESLLMLEFSLMNVYKENFCNKDVNNYYRDHKITLDASLIRKRFFIEAQSFFYYLLSTKGNSILQSKITLKITMRKIVILWFMLPCTKKDVSLLLYFCQKYIT